MKTISILFVIFAVVILASAKPLEEEEEECSPICPLHLQFVCGHNGEEYKKFANPCLLETTNCDLKKEGKSVYTQVDLSNCNDNQASLLSGLTKLAKDYKY